MAICCTRVERADADVHRQGLTSQWSKSAKVGRYLVLLVGPGFSSSYSQNLLVRLVSFDQMDDLASEPRSTRVSTQVPRSNSETAFAAPDISRMPPHGLVQLTRGLNTRSGEDAGQFIELRVDAGDFGISGTRWPRRLLEFYIRLDVIHEHHGVGLAPIASPP